MLNISIISSICILIGFTLILCLLSFDFFTSFILALILTILYKKFHPKFIFKKTITLLVMVVLFIIFLIILNPIISLIIVVIFYISVLIDRSNANYEQNKKDYVNKVKNNEILYKNVIIKNKTIEVISICQEVPFPEKRLDELKELLRKYKDNCCANRTILTKSFIDYDINKFTSESLKKFFDEKDMFIPLKYKKSIESKKIYDEIETILNLKYSYKELCCEEIKLLLNWIFAVDCDDEVTMDKSGAVFDITNEHLYSYKLAGKNTVSEDNFNMIKKLNPELTDYTDILGNEVMFTYHY